MKARNALRWLATAAASTALILSVASPAAAQTAIGLKDDFFFGCDASVYISDSLPGSPGKIEAWGGYSCPSPTKWAGSMRIKIYKGSRVVAEAAKGTGEASTDHVSVSASNASGTQEWRATLWLFRAGNPQTLIATGVISS